MRFSFSTRIFLVSGCAVGALLAAAPLSAQDQETQPAATPTGAETPQTDADGSAPAAGSNAIIVTGSRIKRDPNNSSLPLQVVTVEELNREGITSPEQMLQYLSTSGTGPENLASNADVVSGAQRGTNGLSAANLRGQGSAATLVLLNNRRVAAHGLSGGAVDVNQIPFQAIERVEILKDGASAIYGTDAIGGVVNFITKTNFEGLGLSGNVDVTQRGDGNIYRVGAIAGWGDLQENGFNIMGAVSYRSNRILQGNQRDFTSGNRPSQGLSIDTRGTPIATIFNIGANPNQTPLGTLTQGLTLIAPNGANVAGGGINPLDLPGGAGCESMPDGMNYDFELWQNPATFYACSFDTGRNVVIQQPIDTLTYFGRAVAEFNDHRLSFEVTGSDADSAKLFSQNQYSANNTTLPIAYPLNARTSATYNTVFNQLVTAFPGSAAALQARYGRPIAFRYRCLICGQREYTTNSKTFRASLGLEGPIFEGWDYRAGASYARSETTSQLGKGYHFRGVLIANDPATPFDDRGLSDTRAPTAPGASGPGIVGLFNSGIINPFSLVQTPEALAALDAVSAEGTLLYGGKYEVKQLDYSISGSLFDLPGGAIQMALGFDYRREDYTFNGSPADLVSAPNIFNAAFDNANALPFASREVKAAYAEVLFPILDTLEVTAAGRVDDYSGFGSTFNPKVSFKFRPFDFLMFRGSYNTGFRVPTFNQIFNGRTESPTNTGANIADPRTCPTPTAPVASNPGCVLITPDVVTGGNPNLGPETAEQFSLGVVFQPARLWSASVDFWNINVDDTIQLFSFRDLLNNYSQFTDRFTIDPATNTITDIDSTWANAGARRTQGLEVSFRGGFDLRETSTVTFGLDGTYLLRKREALLPGSPLGPSLIGVFSFNGDLGLRWRHNAFVTYSDDSWNVSLSQIFRNGYQNQKLPGIASGAVSRPDFNEHVDNYILYNFAATFKGLAPNYSLTFGVRNVFDTDPPFAISYDSLGGSGGAWEPRVADPRGRSFTVAVETKF